MVIVLTTEVLFFVQQLPYILYNEGTLFDVLERKQPKALQTGSPNLKLRILALLKPLIPAFLSGRAEAIHAFDVEHAVETILVLARNAFLTGRFALAHHDVVLVKLLRLSMSINIVPAARNRFQAQLQTVGTV